ncbi:prepilin-type N-terminal cleavage/methylation domain-containing protein [Paucibacter sp. APW11]|uniref:Prepilin-type N-terminal cleavage/methylation domain-containing protein n=1 Tax=Roseateles aquae TaxID=3077235 RepID=A0ABU3PHW2_9BURK|nr:prepilin-type N-terminal cleavage/methylation domain-containing protein [Paucibacter sp. APW11]MDT9002171.1 prepilin-type N-terminal cleavage/methylation domain-containing protein [Paucibacter sp. APW11]
MRARGFTLVEVLVALVVMSVMAMMAWRGIDAIVRSRDISQANLEKTARLQTVLAQWEQDLLQVQDSKVVNALSFDGATLRLTRRQPEGLQVVAWTVRNGALYRWAAAPAVDTAALNSAYERSQQALALDSKAQLRALDGITGWQLYFYRGNSWTNAQSSGDDETQSQSGSQGGNGTTNPPKPNGNEDNKTVTDGNNGKNSGGTGSNNPNAPNGNANPPPQKRLPTGVRMVLQFAPGSGLEGQLTRQIALGPQS